MYGQLGQNSEDNLDSLEQVQSLEEKAVIQIAAGSFHSMALTEDRLTNEVIREVWITGQELGFEE